MPFRGGDPATRRSGNLHRITPIPDNFTPTNRVSSTPSACDSIPEDGEQEVVSRSNSGSKAPQLDSSRPPSGRMGLESLAQIPESSLSINQQKSFEGLRGYRPQQRSGLSSPSASEASDTSGTPFSLHRPTPIPMEASGSLSGQSSFSSMKRNNRHQRKAPTISEDGEEVQEKDDLKEKGCSGLPERQDSIHSTGSLHRPTPIPQDLSSMVVKSLGKWSGNRPVSPTILEDEDLAESETDLQNGGLQEKQGDQSNNLHLEKNEPVTQNSSSVNQKSNKIYKALTTSRRNNIQDTARELESSGEGFPTPVLRGGEATFDSVSSQDGQILQDQNAPIRQDLGSAPLRMPPTLHAKNKSSGQVSGNYSPVSVSPSVAPFVDNRENDRDLLGVARFLRMTPGLSRQLIGEMLGENNERSIRVLEIFTSTFDFKGLSFEAALREYLESFRLPGESQKIFRILEVWSNQFFQQNETGVFKTSDAVLQIAFSLILLNTDRHNPQVKGKMSKEDFVKNTKRAIDDKEFPANVLETLYDNIQRRAIRMPPAHGDTNTSNFRRSSSLPESARKIQNRYESPPKAKKSSIFCFG